MDIVDAQHQDLEQGRWEQMTFAMQMANIGSEVSRAIKWSEKDRQDRSVRAVYRALELIDFSVSAAQKQEMPARKARLRELCRCREELCDYFFGGNEFKSDMRNILRYYDQFAILSAGGE